MRRARDIDELREMVEQAVFELAELRAALEFEPEEMEPVSGFLAGVEQGVERLRRALADGSHRFGGADLPFMPVVRRASTHFLPFKSLLETINDTHRLGFAGDDVPPEH